MKKAASALFVAVILTAVAANFSGCKSGASPSGNSAKSSGLPDEPNLTFHDLQGNSVSLASLKGKVVLVNFWATWCEPCRGEIPILIGMQKQFASRGFTLLGIAMDEDGKKVVDPFVQNTQFNVDGKPVTMDYPIVLGSDEIATKFGGLFGMPTSFLISRDGKIAKKYIGALNADQILKDVQAQL
ncbi:MAG TPA: TlpA disulfide reductase family protein [Candidatus Acidoferrales bacterium]|nr:TlpA disulfide reductase family protein [Candidatus Acidoferrales bacterium]